MSPRDQPQKTDKTTNLHNSHPRTLELTRVAQIVPNAPQPLLDMLQGAPYAVPLRGLGNMIHGIAACNLQFQIVSMSCVVLCWDLWGAVVYSPPSAWRFAKRAISATWTPLAARPAALVQRSGQRARGLHGRGCRCWEVPRPAMTKSSLPSRSCAAALAAHAAHPAQLHQCWTRTQRTQRTGATQLCQNAASEKKTMRHDMTRLIKLW